MFVCTAPRLYDGGHLTRSLDMPRAARAFLLLAALVLLCSSTDMKVEPLVGQKASASVLKQAWRPRITMLSTHGFWLAGPAADDPSGAQNPLLNCGLVFAGANVSSGAQQGDDGLVTGMDVLPTDLQGTELVILSACETGLGQLHAGEGVAGLRQVFQLAGARAVMASLWRIPDAETAELTSRFFDHLAAGEDKAQALASAQRHALATNCPAARRAAHGSRFFTSLEAGDPDGFCEAKCDPWPRLDDEAAVCGAGNVFQATVEKSRARHLPC